MEEHPSANTPASPLVASIHTPVLLQEVLDGLAPEAGDIVVDGTVNRAGHAKQICERVGPSGMLFGIDRDPGALEDAARILAHAPCRVSLHNDNFRQVQKIVRSAGFRAIDRALFDLGMSSEQLAAPGRGFSFQRDEPLSMSFHPHPSPEEFTAYDVVNEWDIENIADVLRGYGDERYAAAIARGIGEARRTGPIRTTGDLVRVILSSVPRRYAHGRIHPATKTFQALRTVVNDEIESAREGIRAAFSLLSRKGRIAVITFHSIEDRMVKRLFRELVATGEARLVTRKPVAPSRNEVRENPRARSAKLRVVEKL